MAYHDNFRDISEILGKTLVCITGMEKDSENIIFECSDGTQYKMYHEQDCCEDVRVEDVCGDVSNLLGSPLTMAEDISEACKLGALSEYTESYTWTWYKFGTVKGYVTVRWYGESNGYYSEQVDFAIL